MHYRISLIKLILFVFFISFGVASNEIQSKRESVSVPREIILPVAAYQPSCPLKLSYVDIRAYLNGGGWPLARYRNEGTKAIKGYVIALGSGIVISVKNSPPNEWIKPGEELILGDTSREQMVSLTDELRKELNLEGSMKAITVFIVVRVEFADGTIYSDEKVYNALHSYLETTSK